MACSQAWISYNCGSVKIMVPELWLALRHGLVTIIGEDHWLLIGLWLALRHGLVTIFLVFHRTKLLLWLALRHGLVTIAAGRIHRFAGLWLALRHGLVTIREWMPLRFNTGVVACSQAWISYNINVAVNQ